MSPKQFLALILFYMSYLFFGASVYFTLEQELEAKDREEKLQKRIDIHGEFVCMVILDFNLKKFYTLTDRCDQLMCVLCPWSSVGHG